jgi:uncharacterized membrane protein YphA (DoxX/SURF4 family)
MGTLHEVYRRTDERLTRWMARHGVAFLRVSLGVVFVWFGVLKYFPGLSPAEGLAAATIERLSFGMVTARAAAVLVATMETLIGLGLVFGVAMRITLLLLAVQMVGTVMPVFFFPEQVFHVFPYAPTLEGQYIFKNVVLASAGLVIGATVRGGGLVAEPDGARGGTR